MFRILFIVSIVVLPAFADVFPRDVDVGSRYLFAPVGFDDNDEVVVVLDGYLPDPCHRLTEPYVSVDPNSQRITVGPRARQYRAVCPLAAPVPYTQAVRVGRLGHGDYVLVSKDGSLTERLTVKRSSSPGPDDYLYAPIDKARVKTSGGSWVTVLEGRFTNTCLAIQETMVALTGKTIQVLPIMRFQTEGECGIPCRIKETPFKIEVALPTPAEAGRYLIHVRSLNGQAVNEVAHRPSAGR